MLSVAIDVTHSMICLCWSHGWAVQKRLNQSRCCFGCWLVGPRNHVLDGVEIPTGMGNFGGCPANQKALGVSVAMCAVKGIIQSTITAWQRDCCSQLQCSQLVKCYITLWKIRPSALAMCPFIKILWTVKSCLFVGGPWNLCRLFKVV